MAVDQTKMSPPQAIDNDEIDLFELAGNLWKEKVVIIAFTVVATIIAIAYALMATPVYQSTAGVLPPRVSDVVALNPPQSDSKLSNLSTKDVYRVFTQTLESSTLRDQFYQEVFLPSLTESERAKPAEALRKMLAQTITVKVDDKGSNLDEVIVTLKKDPKTAQEWANRYIEMAGDLSTSELIENREAEVKNIVANIVNTISILRRQAKVEREREIVRLTEAYHIAKAIGIHEPQKPEGKVMEEGANYVDRNLLYLRGSNALKAQLEMLQQRKNDDPFIPQLAYLQQQLDFYESLQFKPADIAVYTFDQPALLPDFPIKPKKKLIVIIGFLLGGMIGVGVALVRIVVRNRRESSHQA